MDSDIIFKIIESSHFNFLIGSGASKNYLSTLYNIEQLLASLENESAVSHQEVWYKVLNVSIKHWYYTKCIKGNLKLIDKNFNNEEQVAFDETNDNYSNFLQALNVLLLKRRNKLLPKEVNIFTTNIDIFLDYNLDRLGLEFNDGFSGKFYQTFNTSNYQKSYYTNSSQYSVSAELPLFNLFKLHGSLTWDKTSETEIRYNADLEVLRSLNKIEIPSNYLIPLSENNVSKTFSEIKKQAESIASEFGDHSALDGFSAEYENLIMINPTKEKFENTTLRLEYYEQMRMFSNILERENSVLFVTGFSFADEHIRQITYRALNSNPTLLVIIFNFSENGKLRVEKMFEPLKYKNLHTDFVGYDFKKVTEDCFLPLAEKFNRNNKVESNGDEISNSNPKSGETLDAKQVN